MGIFSSDEYYDCSRPSWTKTKPSANGYYMFYGIMYGTALNKEVPVKVHESSVFYEDGSYDINDCKGIWCPIEYPKLSKFEYEKYRKPKIKNK